MVRWRRGWRIQMQRMATAVAAEAHTNLLTKHCLNAFDAVKLHFAIHCLCTLLFLFVLLRHCTPLPLVPSPLPSPLPLPTSPSHARMSVCVCTSISCKIHNNSHMHSTYRACITCISYIFALDGPKMLSASHFPHFEKMCAIECFHILSWLGSIRLCALCASLSNPIFCWNMRWISRSWEFYLFVCHTLFTHVKLFIFNEA